MSLLDQVVKGKIVQPFLGLLYGTDGVGKSSFGASMPSPFFINIERGDGNLNVARFIATSYRDVLGVCKELLTANHGYQSLIVDSLDWLENLVFKEVIREYNAKASSKSQQVESIEGIPYGKGFQFALDEWRKLIDALNALRDQKGMNILIIAHSHTKPAKDPTVAMDYERHQLKLNDKASALFREWVDCVFFANFETNTAPDRKGKVRAFGDGARYIYTERRPAFDAKNRFGLPYQLPLEWDSVRELLESANPDDPEVIIHNIQLMLEEPSTAHVKAAVEVSLAKAGTEVSKLKIIENRLLAIVNNTAA